MRSICIRLLKDVLGEESPSCDHEREYRKLIKFCSQYPYVDIKIENSLMKIEKQWIDIAKVIVKQKRKDTVVPTLFAATKQLMEVYRHVDCEIPRYHAFWFNAVLDELEGKQDSSFFYFVAITVFIFYMST